MKIISRIKIFTIFLIVASAFLLTSYDTKAVEGVGVTGTFSAYKYKVVQGERVDTPYVNVVFVNHYNEAVRLQIYTDTPDGVTIPIDQEIITVQPDERVDIPVVVIVAEETLPGTYDIYVKAKLLKEIDPGRINVTSEFALKTQLTVLGEAADLDIDVVDEIGEPINAIMNLYQVDNGSKAPLAYSEKGRLVERVIPGDYEVVAFWNDYQLVKHDFSVVTDEQYRKTLVAQTVQIYAFVAHPVFVEGTDNQLATASLRFVLHNIYRELENSRVSLVVYKDDELLERRDIFLFENLEVKQHELLTTYTPAQGWERAEYKFVLEFYVDTEDENGNVVNSQLYTTSLPAILDTSGGLSFKTISQFFSGQVILMVLLAAVLAGIFFLTKYLLKRAADAVPKTPGVPVPKNAPAALCPDCHGEEEVECPICTGTGKTYYGAIEEECLYCSGVGRVVCATCINPKQLIVCPRCNGNGKVDGEECTYCNGLGHVIGIQYARYKGDIKMKLGRKKR